MRYWLTALAAVIAGTLVAKAQFQTGGAGVGAPSGNSNTVQFNTNGLFGGISGLTSDGASIGFATSSQPIFYGQTAGNCLTVDANSRLISQSCSAGSQTSIAAGSNITTSGSAGNVTVNVVATPSFTTVIATGNLTATTAQISGPLVMGFGPGTGLTFLSPSNLTTSNFSLTVPAANDQLIGRVTTDTLSNKTYDTSANILRIHGQSVTATTGNSADLVTAVGTLTVGDCVQWDTNHNLIDSGSTSCGGLTTNTSIAAGSNITTSGTAGNVTVNVVATPSFTTVIASGNLTAATAQFNGFLTAGGASLAGLTIQTETLSGNLTGTTANFSGNLTAGTAQLLGLLTGTNAIFQTVTVNNLTPTGPNCLQETAGVLQATNSACASATGTSIAAGSNITTSGTATNVTVNVVATPSFTTLITSGNLTSGTAQFTGLLTGTNAQFQTITITNLTPTGPNCLQETGGVLQATNTGCATQTATPSIAAGSNITTSGTAANTTVSVVPTTPEFGVQINHAGVLTADSGFTAFNGIVTYTLALGSNVTTTNSRALSIIGTLSSATVQFGAPLFMNITTNAFAAGTKLVDLQASGISYLSLFASSGMTVLGNITGTTGAISGWLTAPGVNMQTATLAGNLTGTSANFSTNLTANIAQFAGFLSAGGASLSGLTIQTATFSSNLTGTTANFSSNLTANIAQFAGFLSAGGGSLSGLTIQTETLTGALNGSTGNFTSILSASIYTGTATGAGTLSFITPGIAQFATGGTAATNNGWMNWGGEARLAADKGLNISNAGLTPTTLSVNVAGGRSYSIDADIYVTLAVAATSGIAITLSGTYGSTDTHYFGYVVDGGSNTSAAGTSNPIRGATLATAKNTIIGNVSLSGTTGYVSVKGTVSVSAPGTLLIAAATVNTQTAANGVSLTRGSRILVQDMP